MKKKNGVSISFDEWQAAVNEACGGVENGEAPEGWYTSRQLCEPGYLTSHGMSWSRARWVLDTLLAQGKVERRKFRALGGTGMYKPLFHYRLIKK